MTTNTVLVSSRQFPTKQSLKDQIKAGGNVSFHDPSTPVGGMFTLRDVMDRPGHTFTVTTGPRRWFAQITIGANRKVKVS
jgi:hypothetical protein